MTTTTTKAYETAVSVLTTELNTLATATDSGLSGSAAGTALDNSATGYLLADYELVLASTSSRTGTQYVYCYAVYAPDGTNYSDTSSTTAELVASWAVASGTAAVRIMGSGAVDSALRGAKMKHFCRHTLSVSFAASGNTIKAFPHSITNA